MSPSHQAKPPNQAPALTEDFSHFAQYECPDDPLYAALCRIVSGMPALQALLSVAPREQQRPNLWLAAVHFRVIKGAGHPLQDYFASVGGMRAPDNKLADIVADFVQRERTELIELMRTRTTQTNEIGRCAVLWPTLQEVAWRHNVTQLALLDIGCSAGLNLGVDCYRYDYGDFKLGVEALPGIPIISCDLVGARRPLHQDSACEIVSRLGIDPAPVELSDNNAVAWLRACIWPSDTIRAARFTDAIAIANQHHWPVRQEVDCVAVISDWLDQQPKGVLPVIFNSWVLAYFDLSALKSYTDTVTQLVRERGAVWLSAEGTGVQIGPLQVRQKSQPIRKDVLPSTLWTSCSRVDKDIRFEVLARSHAHGRWIEWLV